MEDERRATAMQSLENLMSLGYEVHILKGKLDGEFAIGLYELDHPYAGSSGWAPAFSAFSVDLQEAIAVIAEMVADARGADGSYST